MAKDTVQCTKCKSHYLVTMNTEYHLGHNNAIINLCHQCHIEWRKSDSLPLTIELLCNDFNELAEKVILDWANSK